MLAFVAFLPALLIPAQAAVYTLPEYSGDFHTSSETYPLPAVTIGTFSYTIPTGEIVSSAIISSTFGNSSINSTALANFFLAGVPVASCLSVADPCFSNDSFATPVPWSYTFSSAQLPALDSGAASFTAVQNSPFTVQSGRITLTLTFASASVPEPGNLGLFGAALVGVFVFLCKRK